MQCFESEADIYPEVMDSFLLITLLTEFRWIEFNFAPLRPAGFANFRRGVGQGLHFSVRGGAPILDGNIHDHLSIKVRDVYGEQYCDGRQDEH